MQRTWREVRGLVAAVLTWTIAALQAADGQQAAPIRQLDHIVASAMDSFGTVGGVRQLPDGRLVINDRSRRQLILYDSALRRIKIVADTEAETSKAYGAGTGDIARYVGDTTVFLDWAAHAFVVVLPSGMLGRTFAAPPNPPFGVLAFNRPQGSAGFDGTGRLIYRASEPSRPGPPNPDGRPGPRIAADSALLLRLDLASHRVDTIARYKDYVAKSAGAFRTQNGRVLQGQAQPDQGPIIAMMLAIINPLPVADDWAVLSDGTLAVIRSHDYHVDWIDPDGTTRSTPPIPWAWARVPDSAKTSIIDSLRSRADSVQYGPVKGPPPQYVEPDELPDYYPPFVPHGALADADGHLWIQAAVRPSPAGGPIYDVVDRTGRVIDRVQIPGATSIVGFGRGTMYLTSREGTTYSLVSVALSWPR